MTPPRLYLDLDGVMADFDSHFFALFGLSNRNMWSGEVWNNINQEPNFFRDMPVFDGAKEFFRSIERLKPIILTACPNSYYGHVAKQKREWVREHLSHSVTVLPVMGRKHKPLFMHAPGDILIDDFPANIADWNDAGGIGIHHTDFSATETALIEALQSWSPRS